jgi:phosphatidylglycerophosphate synthase
MHDSDMDAPAYRARDMVRVPGLISLCRLPLAIAFPFTVARPVWAFALLGAAAGTDVLDGWYARRFDQQTAAGAVLDGVMDKVFALTVVATLVVVGSLSVLHALVLGARELGEAPLLARAMFRRDRAPASQRDASALGKLATILQFGTVILVMSRIGPRAACVYTTGVCGAMAALGYWRRELSIKRARVSASVPRRPRPRRGT